MKKGPNKDESNSPIPPDKKEESFDATVFGGHHHKHEVVHDSRLKIQRSPVLILLQGREPKQRFVITNKKTLIGRDPKMEIPIYNDVMVSRSHARIIWENFDMEEEYPRCHIQDIDSRNGTFLNRHRIKELEHLSDGDHISIGSTLFGFYIKDNHELEFDNDLLSMATVDSLTGLVNRRAFMAESHRSIARALRYHYPLCLTLTDVDAFKMINDNYGHGTGDMVLQHLSKHMMKMFRKGDVIGRLGGDEFAILMPKIQIQEALSAVERLRNSLAENPLFFDENEFSITVSVGISALSPKFNTWKLLYKATDVSLYQAKQLGKNRVCIGRAETEG